MVLVVCLGVELLAYLILRIAYCKVNFVYFSPADYKQYRLDAKKVPESSKATTFEPMMRQYFDLAKVLVSIAGASIVFGGLDTMNVGVYHAKLFLAFSVACCLIFCLSCLKFYEDYTHDYTSYTPWKVAFVESFGVSGVVFFFSGYVWWALNLHPSAPKWTDLL